jgi:CPA1 family monovalent cation:H+ antiporter
VQSVEALFLLLLVFVASFAALARKLKIPYPIVLVIAGLLLGFLPGVPRISLDPDIVFLMFLPPLLHAAAWTLSWREFQRNFSSLAKLSVGLVFFTIIGLALSAGKLLPGFDWRASDDAMFFVDRGTLPCGWQGTSRVVEIAGSSTRFHGRLCQCRVNAFRAQLAYQANGSPCGVTAPSLCSEW